MNYRVIAIILTLFLVSCTQFQIEQPSDEVTVKEIVEESVVVEKVAVESPPEDNIIEQSLGMGSLCSTKEECNSFCENNIDQCSTYCDENQDNEICAEGFDFQDTQSEIHEKKLKKELFGNDCESDVIFDHPPVNLEKTKIMIPLGLMTGSHVTPIDHHYFQDFDNTEVDIEVYSPGDGTVTSIGHMPGNPKGEDFRVVIQHTCTVSSIYIHIHTLSDKLAEFMPDVNGYSSTEIKVKAGDLLGYFATNVDYNLVDEEFELPGFVVPEHYSGEIWKIHVPNTFDYFSEPIRSRLIELNVRTDEPIQGKIDYDIDGRLVGNWFIEGSNWYRGNSDDYWATHLAIAYDYIDSDRIVFSIPNFDSTDSVQLGVLGNLPNPAEVGVAQGLVKYELVRYDYYGPDGSSWDRSSVVKGLKTRSYNNIEGVVLAQLLEDRKLKFEVFPGKTADSVTSFTQNAKIYER